MDERQRFREVLAINRAIAGAEDYDEVLRLVVDRTAAFTSATACMLLLSQDDGLARVVRSVGVDPAKAAKLAVPLTERIDADLCDLLGFQARDGFAGVPVIGKRGVMGILAVYRQGPDARDLARGDELISAFADQAAIALDNAERVRRVRDEEALRRSEQRLRALADSIPQLAWTARQDGYIDWYNRRWYEYTGTTPEQMVGWGWQSVHDPAALPVVLRRWKASIAAGAAFEMEFPLRGADGTFRRFLTRAFPLKDPEGNVEQWFGTNTDVTELVQAQEALREADRRKNEFLAILSHELRNPLAPIRNSIYLLERAAPGSAQAARSKEVIRRQTMHLTRLVDDLLDVTRISHGKIELRRTRVDLRDVVRKTTDDLRSLFEESEVELRVEHFVGPVWVDADPTRIIQVLGNLLQNAVKFTPPPGTVTVGISLGEQRAEISVRDTGLGMEPHEVERMFEPFAQADHDLARTKGGLGLGLALVRGLVELHGGSVRARSGGIGKGTEFVFNLPLSTAGPAVEGRPAAAGEAGKRLVLIIEDNADAGQSLAEVLELDGHSVRVAPDGRSGIELARELRPDFVLCDIGLPDVDGYEIARTLRADDALRETRLVALSGYAQPEDVQRALEAGFDAHLPKPPPLDELGELLASGPT